MGWEEVLIAIVTGCLASSGLWTFLEVRYRRKSATKILLVGLAHDRIVHVGRGYIRRGWITFDEYEDFMKYLYDPYNKFGGNGLAEKVAEGVRALPIKSGPSPDTKENYE